MKNTYYIISDAAKKVHVETHVLRYWEDELEIQITRNEAGHRLYTEKDINLFLNIRALKDNGFQLKAIKLLLPDLYDKTAQEMSSVYLLKDELNSRAEEVVPLKNETEDTYTSDEKMIIFENIISGIFEKVLKKQRSSIINDMSAVLCDNLSEEMSGLLNNYFQKEDEHFKQLDQILRSHQKAIKEAAITDIRKRKSKRKFL